MIWLFCGSLAWATTVQTWDFESGPMGFAPSSGLHFEWGLLDDPDASRGWATNLDGNYLNDADDYLAFPEIDLSGLTLPMLALDHRYMTETGAVADVGWVEAQIDGVWMRIDPVYGYPLDIGFAGSSGDWRTDIFDISHLGAETRLRLSFTSGTAVSFPGWFVEEVRLHDGDVAPPQITNVTRPEDTTDVEGPYRVEARIYDDKATPSATLFWTVNDGDLQQTPMMALVDSVFQADIEGQTSGAEVRWWIDASDGLNSQRFPAISDAEFRVALPAPRDVRSTELAQTNRVAASQLTLEWALEEAPYPIREFEVRRDGVRLLRTSAVEAVVPLIEGLQDFTVATKYDTTRGAMVGDASLPLTVIATIPEVEVLSPNSGWPGEQLRLDFVGQDLYLTSEVSIVGPEDIVLSEVSIIDAHHLRAVAVISEDAEPGPLVLSLVRIDGEEIPVPTFQVLPTDGMPRVHSVHPASARQGARTTVFIELDGHPLSRRHPPTVSMGEGVLIEGIRARGSGIDVDIVVAPAAPLGMHAVEVDDGTRVLTGSGIKITDQINKTNTGCSAGRRPQGWAKTWLLLLGALCFRRQPTR